jgi:hypothetical protein
MFVLRSWRRATTDTEAPGANVSATIRRLSSSVHTRRRGAPFLLPLARFPQSKTLAIVSISSFVDTFIVSTLAPTIRSAPQGRPGGRHRRLTILGPVITELEALTGVETRRIHVDKGYRGYNHPHKLGVWISGQVRRVTATIRREMRRRAAVEPVIGHLKAEHRMDRNYLKGRDGDRINAVLAAAGYNFGLVLRWLAELLRTLVAAFFRTPYAPQSA